MNKGMWWAWAIKNSICVICWTVLAIIFDKWWIALFGVLFLSSLSNSESNKHCRVCDKCGKHSPYADDYNKAINKAKEAGWTMIKNEDEFIDYCPECQMKN